MPLRHECRGARSTKKKMKFKLEAVMRLLRVYPRTIVVSRKKRGEQKEKRDKKKKKVEKLKKKNLGANDDAPPPCSSGVKKLIVRVGVRAGAGVMSCGYEYLEIYIIVRA